MQVNEKLILGRLYECLLTGICAKSWRILMALIGTSPWWDYIPMRWFEISWLILRTPLWLFPWRLEQYNAILSIHLCRVPFWDKICTTICVYDKWLLWQGSTLLYYIGLVIYISYIQVRDNSCIMDRDFEFLAKWAMTLQRCVNHIYIYIYAYAFHVYVYIVNGYISVCLSPSSPLQKLISCIPPAFHQCITI